MEQDKRVATTGTGTFLDTAIQNLGEMKVAAQMILDSKLAPDHFYEKDDKGKPDYTKGNVSSVILVCAHGHDLGLKPLVALQHVIPVNGLLSIKGDAAKTLIFKSGKLEPGSWKESQTGSLTDGTLEISITAKRVDTQETMTRSFGIEHAKRAGLWVDDKKIKGSDGWKWIKSAWYKYPERMITYRALGFLARDLFPDVLSGSYTTEEAMDIPADTTVVIPTKDGAEIVISDKDFNKTRSGNLTEKASTQIDKRAGDMEPPEKKEIHQKPMTPDEAYPGPVETSGTIDQGAGMTVRQDDPPTTERASKSTMLNGTAGFIPVYSEEEMKVMASMDMNSLIECDGLMTQARDIDPGKNTNKKLRTILLAHYAGEVVPLIAKFDPEFKAPLQGSKPITDDDIESHVQMEEQRESGEVHVDPPAEPPAEVDPDDPSTWPEGDADPDVAPNESFDESTPDPGHDVNKFEIEIPELVEGKRSFDQVKTLYEELSNKAGVDNNAYDSLVATKFPQFQKYRTKEDFCYMAEISEINELLNSI